MSGVASRLGLREYELREALRKYMCHILTDELSSRL